MRKLILITAAAFFAAGALFADVSPWDAWRLGYTCFEQGEGCRDRGEYTKALKAFQEALDHYNSVRRARPDWNQKVIARRIADCERECERMKRLLGDSEPAPEKMAETGAAALRPASAEVAKQMDDIRKELSEAKAELASLRERTGAQRNYEQEITQLLRDQRIAKERYMLLERRYRDLDRASRQPSRQTQELKEQLLEEKMLSEQLKKQIETLERRRKNEENRFQASETRRRSVERQLGEKLSEIARLNTESSGLRSFREEALGKQKTLESQVADLKKQLEVFSRDQQSKNEELVSLKQRLAVATNRTEQVRKMQENEKKLVAAVNKLNAEKSSVQTLLDKKNAEIEALKVKLIRAEVSEAARQELERHAESRKKNIQSLEIELKAERESTASLRKQLSERNAAAEKETALARLEIENRKKQIEQLEKELELLKKGQGVSESGRVAVLEKELASLRTAEKNTAGKVLQFQLDIKRLESEKTALEKDLKALRENVSAGDDIKSLQQKLLAAEKSAADYRKMLEQNLAEQAESRKKDAAVIAARNEEIKTLRTTLAGMENDKRSAASENVFSEENKKLYNQIEQLKVTLRGKEGEISRSVIEREAAKKQNEELVVAMQKLRDESGKNRQELASLRGELERERNAAGSAAGELQRLRELKTELEQDLKRAVDRSAHLEKRLSNRDSEDFKRLTAAQEERKALNDKAAQLQNDLVRLQAETDTLKQGNTALKNELAKLTAAHTGVTAERDRLKEDSKKQLTAIGKLSGLSQKYDRLKKDFAALQAENRENKHLVEAAKPREAELAQIKLRLTELDQLKAQLTKEQRLNEELKVANRKLEAERGNAIILRSKLNNANKRIGELEPLKGEVAALKKLNQELAVAKNLEAELAQAKAKLNAFESIKLELDHSKQRIRKLELEKLESERQAARAKNLATGTQLLSAELESARRTADELAKDKALREMELARLRTKLNDAARLENELARLKKQKSASDPAVVAEMDKLKRIAGKAGVMADTIKEQNSEIERLKKRQTELQQELSGLRVRAAEGAHLTEMVKKLSSVHTQLKDMPADKKDMAALQMRLAELEAAEESLKKVQAREKALLLENSRKEKELAALREKSSRLEVLKSENDLLRKQNKELDGLQEMKTELLRTRQTADMLKVRTAELEKLRQQLVNSEIRYAEKQAELDRSQRLLAVSEQLRKDLTAQRQENSAVQLELSRARNEVEQMKMKLVQTDALRRELERQKRLTDELAAAKGLEGELAQAKLRLAEFEQVRKELARVTKYNNELTEVRQRLEKELANRSSSEDRMRYQLDMVSTLPAGKPDDFVASGRIAEADSSFELAVWNYEQALKIDRNHVGAAERLARIMLDRRNYKRAVDLFTIARAADPVNVSLACGMASAYIGLKRYGNALAILNPLAERSGENYLVQMLLGKALAGSGSYKAAEARLRIAVRQAPTRVFAPRLELAKFLISTDVRRLEEAALIYEAARVAGAAPDIDLEPKLGSRLDERREVSSFLVNAAREAERGGDWKSAGWYYKQLVELGREKEKYIPRLAFARYRGGDAPGAMEILTFNRVTAQSALVQAMIQLAGREYSAMLASARKAVALNGGKPVMLPADWSEFAIEFERLKRKHSPEMSDALRRSFRIR